MKRSPGPTSCSPFSMNSTASASASSRSIRFCIRVVSGSRGRCTPGQVDQHELPRRASGAVATPRIARRVVCGRFGHDRDLLPHEPVDQRRLARVRPPGERDEAERGITRSSATTRSWSASISPPSVLVVVAAQVQHAVHHRLGHVLGVLGADHHVAELARAGHRAGAVDRERQHVGGAVAPAVLAVQRADPLLADERDGEMPVAHAGGRQRRPAALRNTGSSPSWISISTLRPACAARRASRAPASRRARCRRRRCAGRACGAPRPRRRSARSACPPRP